MRYVLIPPKCVATFDFSYRLTYTFIVKNGIVSSMTGTGNQNRFQTSYPPFWSFWDKSRAVLLLVTAEDGELAEQLDAFTKYPRMV